MLMMLFDLLSVVSYMATKWAALHRTMCKIGGKGPILHSTLTQCQFM